MPMGTPILAARAGTVAYVVDLNEGRGSNKPNNEICVDHGDVTMGFRDIEEHDGVPRTSFFYRSGNDQGQSTR